MAISGVDGFVQAGGLSLKADKWTADLKQVVVDRSNFTTAGEPLNAAGQRTGDITMEGPYEGVIGVDRGQLVILTLGISQSQQLAVVLTARVSALNFTNDKDSGPRWSLTASQYGPATIQGL